MPHLEPPPQQTGQPGHHQRAHQWPRNRKRRGKKARSAPRNPTAAAAEDYAHIHAQWRREWIVPDMSDAAGPCADWDLQTPEACQSSAHEDLSWDSPYSGSVSGFGVEHCQTAPLYPPSIHDPAFYSTSDIQPLDPTIPSGAQPQQPPTANKAANSHTLPPLTYAPGAFFASTTPKKGEKRYISPFMGEIWMFEQRKQRCDPLAAARYKQLLDGSEPLEDVPRQCNFGAVGDGRPIPVREVGDAAIAELGSRSDMADVLEWFGTLVAAERDLEAYALSPTRIQNSAAGETTGPMPVVTPSTISEWDGAVNEDVLEDQCAGSWVAGDLLESEQDAELVLGDAE